MRFLAELSELNAFISESSHLDGTWRLEESGKPNTFDYATAASLPTSCSMPDFGKSDSHWAFPLASVVQAWPYDTSRFERYLSIDRTNGPMPPFPGVAGSSNDCVDAGEEWIKPSEPGLVSVP